MDYENQHHSNLEIIKKRFNTKNRAYAYFHGLVTGFRSLVTVGAMVVSDTQYLGNSLASWRYPTSFTVRNLPCFAKGVHVQRDLTRHLLHHSQAHLIIRPRIFHELELKLE